ncbi:response regulator transcription factor [Sporosarcina highlanderae]|uniref:Helix-turn-helix domain-containing protein n=1 Tax=Sporosarcina highlanderae TaxID=3035916 RepID=A0ABT8JLS9_9BACL|nr:response regulator transcription factor [Sporosarcina highlanderae]MDN4606113.1 helix-turn-helix domain-containing protein [Sporosarcina highlanderae]
MKILLLVKDSLEAQGLKWLLTSQWSDMQVEIAKNANVTTEADLYIVDMSYILADGFELPPQVAWLGISSERTFQTVYKALSLKAEDVLFRPFQPDRLIKQVQQIRYRWRNERAQLKSTVPKREELVTYENLLVGESRAEHLVLLSLIAPSRAEELDHLVRELEKHDFPTIYDIFPFSDFVLVVHRLREIQSLQEAYSIFFAQWKRQSDALLTIYLYADERHTSYRDLYMKMRRFHERIFYDGYDILTVEKDDLLWRDMDPFLSPLEQREWVEMLEKRQVAAIRQWMEQDFLTLEAPFPDPEMVRVRLTSILAQIRRYMTANSLKTQKVEQAYDSLFETIIREPVMYHIVQSFTAFISELLQTSADESKREGNLVEKVQERIAANYWDATWNLAACADELKLHKSTLSRKYAMEAGEPFSDALLRMRIEEAKRLLTETDLSIAEVSSSAGFTHSTYFSRRFKEETGMTPYQFRMKWV